MRHLSRLRGLMAAALVTACSSAPTGPGDISDGGDLTRPGPLPAEPLLRIVVAPAAATIKAGAILQLRATARSDDHTVVRQIAVTWRSSDEAIATVSTTGVVRALSPGSAEVQARWETSTALVRITVSKADPGDVACRSIVPPFGAC